MPACLFGNLAHTCASRFPRAALLPKTATAQFIVFFEFTLPAERRTLSGSCCPPCSRRRSPRSWTATPRPRSLTPGGAMTLSRPGLPRRVLGWLRCGKSSDRTPEHLLCIADDFVDDLGRWLNARHEADALAGPVRERFSVASRPCPRPVNAMRSFCEVTASANLSSASSRFTSVS